MAERNPNEDQTIRERAYFIWEREGRPVGCAADHWQRAINEGSTAQRGRDDDLVQDEEKILAGRDDVNMPALLTKDVPGG